MNFTSEFFAGNRQRLLEVSGLPLIVITANGLLQRSADTTFPFRQDSNFWYLTGVEYPDFILVYGSGELFLIAPQRSEHRDAWDGSVDQAAIKLISGIEEVLDHHAGWNKLDRLLKKHKKVGTAVSPETYFGLFGFYANPARSVLLKELSKHRSIEIVDIKKAVARLRQVKQAVELFALRQAIDITSQALQLVRESIGRYRYEYEVEADISKTFLTRGAVGHAYQPIVACGPNAATIHYISNNAPLKIGDLLLMDVGAEVSNYSADITRTYATAKPTERQQAVFAAVVRVQNAAFKLLKPGVNLRQYEKQVDAVMAKELKGLGLLDDLENRKKLKKYYPHLTTHFLGLDTHDSSDYDLPLEPDMVLTVEPGIYIPEEGIGIRIEDDVLITKNGIEILSANLSNQLM